MSKGYPVDWIALATVVIGGGGVAAIINAIRDWRKGAAQRIEEAEQKHLMRLDTELIVLRKKLGALELYNLLLINTLIENGIRVPGRDSIEH